MSKIYFSLLVLAIFALPCPGQAKFEKPGPNSPKENFAKNFSLKQGGIFLDQASIQWTRSQKCGSCHTNYVYLLARPTLGEKSEPMDEVRKYFEQRVSEWDTKKPRWPAEVVMTGTTLAIHDALTTKKLHPLSRKALDRMWDLQRADGAWNWLKCNWPPFENNDDFGALMAVLGVGLAPDHYAETDKAKKGLDSLRDFFRKNPPPDLHHRAWLMWASQHVQGLMTEEESRETTAKLLACQNKDGGWSFAGLGPWKRRDKTANDPTISDGYGTGMVVYILRQTGVPAENEKVQAGLNWLRSHQRESGRWFTRSPTSDNYHYITHTGSAFAVMALRACGEEVK